VPLSVSSKHPGHCVFLDPAVRHADLLLEGIAPAASVHVLARSGDALAEIAAVLSGAGKVSKIAIVAHGTPGALELSGRRLSQEDFAGEAPSLARIKKCLATDAEVTLVACSVATGPHGHAFVNGLETALGVPVRGAEADLGGDAGWSALPSAAAIFSAKALDAYPEVLAVTGTPSTGDDSLFGDADNDSINGDSGADTISGGAGNDQIYGGADSDQIYGGDGNDTLYGEGGNDVLYGGDGDDFFYATDSDTIYGDAGNDTLGLGNGADISGGSISGVETVELADGASVSMTITQYNAFANSFSASGTQTITLSGNQAVNTVNGIENLIVGDDDNLSDRGIYIKHANVNVTTTSTDDVIRVFIDQNLNYSGTITISPSGYSGAITMGEYSSIVNATLNNVTSLTVSSGPWVSMTSAQHNAFQSITGSSANIELASGTDAVTGDADISSYIFGTSYTGTLTLGAAGQGATGSSGDNIVNVGTLASTGTLSGGAGTDTLQIGNGGSISGATVSGFENLTLADNGSATMTAAQLNAFTGTVTATGTNTVTLSSTGSITGADISAIETIRTASGGSETITLTAVQASGKTLTATDAGNDKFVVTGSTGNQSITGSAGADTIDGGAGADTLAGGAGADSLTGGADTDRFTGSASDLNGDTITDLASGETILLTGVTGLSTANVRFNGTNLEIDTDATTFASPKITIGTVSDRTGDLSIGSVTDSGGNTLITFAPGPVSASTTAAGFNTTAGTNLSPGSAFAATNDTLTIADASHITSASVANGGGGTDTIVLANGSDLTTSGFTLTNFEVATLSANAGVTMSESQHDGFSTINGNTGTEAITLATSDGDDSVTGSANIESYVLNDAFTFTIGTAGQNVTGSAGANQTVQSTASIDNLSGVLNGGAGGSDTLVLDTGDNIASATVSNFENLTLESGASVTMTAAQNATVSGTVAAAGSETVNITGNGNFTTLANIETYSVGDDSTNTRTITLGGAGTSVTVNSSTDAVTFNAGGLSLTGTLTGEGTVNDTLQLGNNADITGATISNIENLTVDSGASVTMTAAQNAAFSGTISAAGSETVNITGDGNFTTLANIETYSIGDDSTDTRTVTISGATTNVTADSATDAVTFRFGSGITYTGTITGEGSVADTLSLGNGANIAGGTLSNVANLAIDNVAGVTMTAAQHDAFSNIAGTGTNQITLSATGGDTAVTADADIEYYVLGTGGIAFTLGSANQDVTGSSGDDIINVGGQTLGSSSDLIGNAGTDTLQLSNGANIDGASSVTGFENLALTSGASVTMSASQSAQFTGTVTAAGSETINILGNGNFTTLANIETYSVGDDSGNSRTITLGDGGTSVTAASGTDAITFNAGGLTLTGTLTGDGGTADTLELGNGADISGATLSGIANLTLASGSSTTMSVSQLSAFSGGTITAAGTETVTLTGNGNVSSTSGIENYVLGDDSTDTRTFTVTNAANSVTANSATDAVTFDTGSLTLTGTLSGDGTVNDTLSIANGANISGATISGIENLTIAGTTGNATMTAAQLNGFSGTMIASGTNTLTLTSTGSVTGADLSAIETLATAGGSTAQSITLTAAQAAGTTLTAGDSSLDSFVVTGSAGSQTLVGSAGSDTIDGGAGDDTISGGEGADALSGGDGADSLFGQNGADSLFGLSGDDFLNGGAGADTLNGGDGNDSIVGGTDADVMIGGAGNDTFSGTGAELNGDTISGIAAGDQIIVTSDDLSALNGTTLGSTITTGGGTINIADATAGLTINANVSGGNTTLTFTAPAPGGGSSGGNGSSGPVTVNDDPADTATGGARTITNTGSTSGSAPIVQNTGNNGNVVTATLPPSVSITSAGPATSQSSGDAMTTLTEAINTRGTGVANDLIGGAQNFLNRLGATTTVDVRTIIPTTTGSTISDPIVISGSGSTSGQSEAFVIDMRSMPSGSTLQLDNIEFASVMGQATITGGAGQNYVVGDDAAQFISLGVEDDTLAGGGGADSVGSGWGEDIVYGNQGADLVFGGGGMDTVYGGQDADTVRGDNDNDWVYGNKGDDTLLGGNGDDRLYGGQDNDIVYGNAGNDSIAGNLGNDTLYGGQGNDLISGGNGADLIAGNKGDDTLSGGAGADTFVFEFGGGNDQVADFQIGTDTLALENGLGVSGGTESGGNTTVTFSDGSSVTVIGVSKTDLAAATGWELG
jgi:Ca2+-binding RTX toxin-like protein